MLKSVNQIPTSVAYWHRQSVPAKNTAFDKHLSLALPYHTGYA